MVTWNSYYPYHYLEIMRGRAIRGTTNPQNSTTFRSLRAFRNQMWLCVFCISKKNKIVIKCRNDQVDELQGLKKKKPELTTTSSNYFIWNRWSLFPGRMHTNTDLFVEYTSFLEKSMQKMEHEKVHLLNDDNNTW